MVMINNLIVLILWYSFAFYMLELAAKKIPFNDEKRFDIIRNKKKKTEKEQIEYTKILETTRIGLPLFLIIITVFSIISYNLLTIYIRSYNDIPETNLFLTSMLLAIIISITYSWFINRINPTKNQDSYFVLILIYNLFISISLLLNIFYPTNIYWVYSILIIIIIYYLIKNINKVMKIWI